MKPITFLVFTIFLFLCGADTASAKPNIILIMADDIGYECFRTYGSKQYQTPNIDRMAENGMRFDHCYSQPLCTPSRVKIMTGISNARNYAAFSVLQKDQKTIGHYMKDLGYHTMVAGKWQLLGAEQYAEAFRNKGSWPEKTGFDRVCLWQVDKLGNRYWKPKLYFDGKNNDFRKDDYGPDIVVEHISDFMEKHRQQNKDQPFFVYYPMILVHDPFLPTPDSESRSEKNKQKNFEDMVAYMDKLVGKIIRKTEELNIDKETLILFAGDNGTNKAIKSKLKGRTIRGGKGKTDDSGTRVPFVAYWPSKVPSGKVSKDLIDFSDIVPTLQEVAGGKPITGLDGISFAPQLQGEPGKPRKWMFCYYNPRPEKTEAVRFVRDREWKLYGDGRFYHITKDVKEKTSLPASANSEAHAKLEAALKSMPANGQSLLQYE